MKTKYSAKVVAIICLSLKDHQGRLGSANIAGITYRTFKNWYDSKPAFKKAVDEAEDENLMTTKTLATQAIVAKFYEDWRAAAWFLERRFPEEFGRIDKKQVVLEGDNQVLEISRIDYSKLSQEQIKALWDIYETQSNSVP